jgi:hypothetical protein
MDAALVVPEFEAAVFRNVFRPCTRSRVIAGLERVGVDHPAAIVKNEQSVGMHGYPLRQTSQMTTSNAFAGFMAATWRCVGCGIEVSVNSLKLRISRE